MSRSEWFDGIDPDDADKQSGTPAGRDSGGPARPPRPPAGGTPPKRGPLGTTIAILAGLLVLVLMAAGIITDLWWFDSVGFRDVFTTQLTTRVFLFVAAFVFTAGAVAASLLAAYRTRPLRIPATPSAQVLDQYRQVLDPLRRLATVVIPSVLGLLAGAAAMGAWKTFLLWRNAVPFGTKDPQFGLDVGFFVFTLPWLRFLVSFFTVVLLLSLIAAAFTHYVYGGLQLPGRGVTTRAAFIQIATIASLLALARAAAYWLDRYTLTTSESRLITGITYTDANAVLPIKAILAVATIMCAGFFVASIWTRSWRLPLIGVGLLTVLSIVAGGLYPAAVQALQVRPSEKSLEAKYIQWNIEATRKAFAIEGIKKTPYAATTDAAPGQLRADAETIPGIRLVDPNIVSPTFRQFEGLRQYYAFPDILDVDRYTIDGKASDSVVAVRELNIEGLPAGQRNWLNDHTVYTHGFGFIGAYGNRRTSEGDPQFFSSGFSSKGPMGVEYEPRIYFGEQSPAYSIVGAPENATPREFDFPDDRGEGGQANNTYNGNGGVAIGSFFRKLAYAVKYREPKFLLSDAVNSESRLLDHRTPRERVERVAPWLTIDGNAYPAVVDGKVKWIVDGYTTTARYPNSKLTDLSEATSDSVSERSTVVVAGAGQVNYIRNSVKATVDAYDGSVKLYGWDTSDPLLQAWSKAFPGAVAPMSEMSASLMSHVRYPQDLFKVQRQLLSSYHVTDANSFYGGGDFWRVPKDPTHATQDQPVYYQSLAMPDQDSPAFSLTTTFIPSGTGREILRGFLAVDADAGSTAGKPAESYGAMRLLELPRNSAVDGPGQVQNQIEVSTARSQSPTEPLNLSQFIAQNRQSGKTLTYGNLLTLPVGEGLLYVQPMYVQASREGGSFPQNKATVAVFGKRIAWGETLDQALDGLFGGNSGATAGDSGTEPGTTPPPAGGTTPPPASATAQLAAIIEDIEAANAAGQAALKKGDFAAYGEAQKDLQDAIARASALGPQLAAPTAPSPNGSASPTATPSPTSSP
ncbi:membrane protein [Knoellia sinensis KCTC 19936]|uniref:UPF0182 protein N802_02650 n=1 Tax=Knoellia sinensis KCTC 19936 TaxID=1385520 RepID=A0A0A0JC27_9MICO|nr:UPF0182 family protein [Knoellia sinensis]KGN34945.1 membrane protein [Knoellia sinensis KCTC 19936]